MLCADGQTLPGPANSEVWGLCWVHSFVSVSLTAWRAIQNFLTENPGTPLPKDREKFSEIRRCCLGLHKTLSTPSPPPKAMPRLATRVPVAYSFMMVTPFFTLSLDTLAGMIVGSVPLHLIASYLFAVALGMMLCWGMAPRCIGQTFLFGHCVKYSMPWVWTLGSGTCSHKFGK